MIELRIARRYLWAARKEAHTAFLSLISMLGLAVGVATLLISLALLSGLQGQIKERLIESSPQLLIEPVGSTTIDDFAAIDAEAQRLGMTDVRPMVRGIVWAANPAEKRGRPVHLGSAGTPLEPGTIGLSRDMAAVLGVDVGDPITVIAPRTRLTPFGPVPVWKRYRVGRLLPASGEQNAPEAVLDLNEIERLFGTRAPTSIEMHGNPALADSVQQQLARDFPNVQVKTWKEINRPLFLALRLEKIVMFVTISLIIFVAALNLISSLSMLILEKRPGVGVLRTLGATERTILLVFLAVGLLIGITGTIVGNIFGLGIAFAANHFHLIPLPSDLYFIHYLPFTVEPGDVAGVNVVAIALSVLATWYPARAASRLDPIDAIREEA